MSKNSDEEQDVSLPRRKRQNISSGFLDSVRGVVGLLRKKALTNTQKRAYQTVDGLKSQADSGPVDGDLSDSSLVVEVISVSDSDDAARSMAPAVADADATVGPDHNKRQMDTDGANPTTAQIDDGGSVQSVSGDAPLLDDISLDELGLHSAAISSLIDYGIYTADELLLYRREELAELHCVNEETLSTIERHISEKAGRPFRVSGVTAAVPEFIHLTDGQMGSLDCDISGLNVGGLLLRQLRKSQYHNCRQVAFASRDELMDCPGVDLDATFEIEAALSAIIGARLVIGCFHGEAPYVAKDCQPFTWRMTADADESAQKAPKKHSAPTTAFGWMLTLEGQEQQAIRELLECKGLPAIAEALGISLLEASTLIKKAIKDCPAVREDEFLTKFRLSRNKQEFIRKTGEPEATYRFLSWRNKVADGGSSDGAAKRGTSFSGGMAPAKPGISADERRKLRAQAREQARKGWSATEMVHDDVNESAHTDVEADLDASEDASIDAGQTGAMSLEARPSYAPASLSLESCRRVATAVDKLAKLNREYTAQHFYNALPELMREKGINSAEELFEVLRRAYHRDPDVELVGDGIIRFGMPAHGTRMQEGPAEKREPMPQDIRLGEYREFLRSELTSDCCDRKLVAERFKARFPDGPSNPFSDWMLGELGYWAVGKKLLMREGIEPADYFAGLIDSHELFQRGDPGFENAIFNDPQFRKQLRKRMRSHEVLEYEEGSFISSAHLCEQMGVSLHDIKNYSQDVVRELRGIQGMPVPFTMWSLKNRYGIQHPLDVLVTECGMSDFLFETLFDIDPHVQTCTMAGTRIFLETDWGFNGGNFIECLIEMNGPMEIDDLGALLKDSYGVDCPTRSLRLSIRSSSLYYDDITESVYNSRREWQEMVDRELAN